MEGKSTEGQEYSDGGQLPEMTFAEDKTGKTGQKGNVGALKTFQGSC